MARKTARDGGRVAKAIAAQIEKTEGQLGKADGEAARSMARQLRAALEAFLTVVDFVAGQTKSSPNAVFAGSVPYLLAAGKLVGGWQLARSLLIAQQLAAKGEDVLFMKAKIATARFYAEHILNGVPAMAQSIVEGAQSVTALPVEAF
ncbi:3-methylmercaptopropionyl-CoA dehydrogenase [compost metagenome]